MEKYLLEMFAGSLLLTLVLELPIAWCMGLRGRRLLLLVVLVNILTNPVAVLLHWLGVPQIAIEAAVIAVEAAVYCSFSHDDQWIIPHPVLLAWVANSVSWVLGVLIQWIGGKL